MELPPSPVPVAPKEMEPPPWAAAASKLKEPSHMLPPHPQSTKPALTAPELPMTIDMQFELPKLKTVKRPADYMSELDLEMKPPRKEMKPPRSTQRC